jgi:Ca2+-binding RTX toxin-like protein
MPLINADVSSLGADTLRGSFNTDNGGTTTINEPDNFVYDYIYNRSDDIYGKSGNDTIIGDRYDTNIQTYGYDRLYGEDGDDTIYGDTGPEDSINGAHTGSSNKLVGGAGKDTIYGGWGSSGDYIYGDQETTSMGSAFDGADKLYGFGGNDWIYGGGGNDFINGGDDNDTRLNGGMGNDTMRGGLGNDSMRGDAGSDTFIADDGDDDIDGDGSVSHNTEVDVLSYIEMLGYVTVDLSISGGQATNAGGFDSIRNIEKLIGSKFSDRLAGSDADETIEGRGGNDDIRGGAEVDKVYGGDGNDKVFGGSGADRVYGNAGTDKLYGGTGKDKLYGGTGKDTFYFAETTNATNRDIIDDFRVVDDTIGLKKTIFNAIGSSIIADEFHIGSRAADKEDRIIYNKANGYLSYDADGTGSKAAAHFATLDVGLKMTVSDFVLF